MSAYCTQADIEAEVGTMQLIAFTDDMANGTINTTILSDIIANCSAKIDGRLSNIYAVPFGPTVPSKVHDACVVFVCERLYKRRLTPDERNPYKDEADDLREDFKRIGNGELELDLNFPRDFAQGAAIQSATPFSGGYPFGGSGSATTL